MNLLKVIGKVICCVGYCALALLFLAFQLFVAGGITVLIIWFFFKVVSTAKGLL